MLAKRAFDIFVTLTAAVAWVPALLIASLAILLLEGRPVFYASKRVVRRGQVLRVIKFRTMVRNAESVCNREVIPVEDGVRFLNVPPDSKLYTPIGRLIERMGFTELPQLFLVLAGRMSLVGNRPLPENVMAALREANDDVDARVDTPAGLTGPVQLVGRERLSDAQRLDIERTYCRVAVHSNTWALDFLILLYTVLAVMRLRAPMTYREVCEFLGSRRRPVHAREPQPLLLSDEVERGRRSGD